MDCHVSAAGGVGEEQGVDVDVGAAGLGEWRGGGRGHEVAAHGGGDAVGPPAGAGKKGAAEGRVMPGSG